MTEVKCYLGVLGIRDGEVRPPGEGVCLALIEGGLSQKGPSELDSAPGLPWSWTGLIPPGSRAELFLLVFCLHRGWFQDMLKAFLWGCLSFLLVLTSSRDSLRKAVSTTLPTP